MRRHSRRPAHFDWHATEQHMVLHQGQEKMSKSDPASAIFMEDSEAEVKTKIKKAFCPPAEVWQPTKLFPRRGSTRSSPGGSAA